MCREISSKLRERALSIESKNEHHLERKQIFIVSKKQIMCVFKDVLSQYFARLSKAEYIKTNFIVVSPSNVGHKQLCALGYI